MNTQYRATRDVNDENALRDVLVQCFDFPLERWPVWSDAVGRENLRLLEEDGRVLGGLALLPMGQWFGGRSVTTGGVAAVGVAPEARASGSGRALMIGLLGELRERGFALSTLFASTQRLYRGVGYEQAGLRTRYRVPSRALGRGPRELPVHPLRPPDREALNAIYRRRAESASGHLDRPASIWWRILNPPGASVYAYLVGDPTEGYVVYTHRGSASGYDLDIRDQVVLTPRAARTLWSFLADHGSMVRQIEWFGPAVEPLVVLLPEEDHTVVAQERWMLRIVDVVRALEGRGYPAGVTGRLVLEVHDGVFPEADGVFVLEVGEGGARAVKSATQEAGARLRMEIGALAPLYSGFLTPRALREIGRIEGEDEALAEATRIFAGPEPWMSESF